MTAAWDTALNDPDPLVALGATRALGGLLSTWEAQLVGEAVAAGATWETIGGAFGVSRQAAWQRFHDDVHEFHRKVKADMHELRHRHRQEMLEFREKVRGEGRGRRRGR